MQANPTNSTWFTVFPCEMVGFDHETSDYETVSIMSCWWSCACRRFSNYGIITITKGALFEANKIISDTSRCLV